MNKIYKLFVDENIKTWKKFSTKLLIIVILLALAGSLALVKFMEHMEENSFVSDAINVEDNWKKMIETEIESFNQMLKEDNLDEESKKSIKQQLEKYKLCLEYDINPYGQYNWKMDLLEQLAELITEENNAIFQENIEQFKNMIKNEDFAGYIDTQKQLMKTQLDNNLISKEEYDDEIIILDITKEYNIGKEQDGEYWKESLLSEIKMLQKNIRTGINQQSNKVLTVKTRQEQEDLIKIYMYRIGHDLPTIYQTNNYRTRFETIAQQFVVAVIAITAIIIAGGTISTETSSGTIKFWALTPNKRWKILTAKILSVLFYIIVITLVMALLTILCANIFFTETPNEYIYVDKGEIRTIGNTLYTIEMYFAKIIPVIIFTIFAVMLSTITRNTAAAVSFGVATYMGNGIVMAIINQFIQKDWIKFIPFNNLNIADKIFVNEINIFAMTSDNFATSTSLAFSLAVLGVCTILMLVTMYDSFNHRDII